MRDEPNVIDVRNLGLAAAVELAPRAGEVSKRAMEIFHYCFDHGAMVRYVGDIIAIGPALIATESELEQIVALIRAGIRRVA